MHYLDDVLRVRRPEYVHKQHELAGSTLEFLGLSVEEAKDKLLNTTQTILGLECDAMKQELKMSWDETERCVAFAHSLM